MKNQQKIFGKEKKDTAKRVFKTVTRGCELINTPKTTIRGIF